GPSARSRATGAWSVSSSSRPWSPPLRRVVARRADLPPEIRIGLDALQIARELARAPDPELAPRVDPRRLGHDGAEGGDDLRLHARGEERDRLGPARIGIGPVARVGRHDRVHVAQALARPRALRQPLDRYAERVRQAPRGVER